MKNITFLLLLSLSVSCTPTNKTVEINGVTINNSLLSELKIELGSNPLDFQKINYYYESKDSSYTETVDTINNGFFFKPVPEQKAKKIVDVYSDYIKEEGNYIFLKNLTFDDSWSTLYEVTIVKAKDQFEILKIMNTEAVNYDLTNDDIITKMKKWDKLVGLNVVIAQGDRVEAYMDHLPNDLTKFTNEVYEFCPDVIDQGYGEMKDMISDYKANKYFWMWWD